MNNDNATAIDAVITWVDGGDAQHVEKINRELAALGFKPRSAASTRFASRGEIFHCLASIQRFAPFFRHIHIVTDNQRPALQDQSDLGPDLLAKIRIVDHRDIFRDRLDLLPTFNSRSIEAMLYRIPGLADRYVYLNDDFSFIRPTKPEDFFGPNGPVLRGWFDVMPQHRIKRRLQNFLARHIGIRFDAHEHYSYKLSQAKAAQYAGFEKRFFLLGHNPHALRRQTFERFFEHHPEVLESNLADKFRTDRQFNVAALAYHLELREKTCHPQSNRNLLYIKPKNQWRLPRMLAEAESDPATLFCCVQSLDLFTPENQDRLLGWLQERLR